MIHLVLGLIGAICAIYTAVFCITMLPAIFGAVWDNMFDPATKAQNQKEWEERERKATEAEYAARVDAQSRKPWGPMEGAAWGPMEEKQWLDAKATWTAREAEWVPADADKAKRILAIVSVVGAVMVCVAIGAVVGLGG